MKIVRKYSRHAVIIAGVIIIAGLLFQPFLGYHYGPHRVASGETLSEVLNDAFRGDTFLSYNALNNVSASLNVNTLWKNTEKDLQDGDLVSLRKNELIIKKPNDQEFHAQLFSDAAYQKRIMQVLVNDAVLLVFAIGLILLVIQNARGIITKDSALPSSVITVLFLAISIGLVLSWEILYIFLRI